MIEEPVGLTSGKPTAKRKEDKFQGEQEQEAGDPQKQHVTTISLEGTVYIPKYTLKSCCCR